MIVVDFFIVNVALPSMQEDLHAGTGAIEWVVAGYGLTFAVLLVISGRLGDRFGRRRILVAGLALFGVASAACAAAPSPGTLVAARLAQGVAAALIAPNVLSIMGVVYTGTQRVRAISIYGMVLGVSAAAGQLIGGGLIEADPAGLGWRTIFLINIPIALVAVLLAPAVVPESRAERAPGLDIAGATLITLGLVAIVLPLVEGRQQGWPAWTWASLACAPVLLGAFAMHQRWLANRGGAPLLDPRLFRARAVRAGLVTQLGFWSGQAALFLVLALYLQQGRGLDPLHAGLVFSIMAGSYVAASLRAPALTLRHGRSLVAFGALLLAAGEGLLLAAVADIGVHGSVALLVPGLIAAGAGMGLCITPLTTIVLAHADSQRAGAVSGALSTMQQVGNAVGVALTGAIFFGAARDGDAHALELSLLELACLLVAVAALTRLLPRLTATAHGGGQ
jgi:EmrB/QacA subfamily drug resistance transporter